MLNTRRAVAGPKKLEKHQPGQMVHRGKKEPSRLTLMFRLPSQLAQDFMEVRLQVVFLWTHLTGRIRLVLP